MNANQTQPLDDEGYRDDVRALLDEAGWRETAENCVVAENGALWSETNDCLDSGIDAPDKAWSVAFDSNVPASVIAAAALAASGVDVPALLAEVQRLKARVAALENALAATGRSLSSFIFDSDDPGADALGAQWLYHQAMPQVDDPFAQPRAFRSSVFSEAAKAVEGMDGRPSDGEYSREYLNGYLHALEDAAERLEKLADQAAEGTEVSS
ncbi:hypothetical protein AB0L04_00780 [Streptomyces glaucescens]|uniref:hypothetical protein n=1 Tax=Streptomyces glaucescens TaxID=1907 RepID=UPI00344DE2E2